MMYYLHRALTKRKHPAQKGRAFEHDLYRSLTALPSVRVYHGMYLPLTNGGITEVDLLLISKTRIYVFEAKAIRSPASVSEAQWPLPSGKTVRNPFIQNTYHVHAVAELFNVPVSEIVNGVIVLNAAHSYPNLYTASNVAAIVKEELNNSPYYYNISTRWKAYRALAKPNRFRFIKRFKHWRYRRHIARKQKTIRK